MAPRKFQIGDTVELIQAYEPCMIKRGVVKYILTINWPEVMIYGLRGRADKIGRRTIHYIGFESDKHANWGESMFRLVGKCPVSGKRIYFE